MSGKLTVVDNSGCSLQAQTGRKNQSQGLRLYVYYRLREGVDTNSAIEAIRNMQEELVGRHGARAELLRRRDDSSTWMEIYDLLDDADDFELCLVEAVARHQLDDLLTADTERHIERFVSVTGGQ